MRSLNGKRNNVIVYMSEKRGAKVVAQIIPNGAMNSFIEMIMGRVEK